jgi:CRP/FNR family cyclic AMP-dependent transcriptional regulator
MSQFDWKAFFAKHPIFSSLTEVEIERVLDDAVSQEREVSKGETVVREGDLGSSIFVIGTGAATIKISGPGGTLIPLVTLQSGDFFGEMALLQHLPRAATVTATEPSMLREIQGQPFLQLLREHPDVEFRMLLILSERLRRIGQLVVALANESVDKRLQIFDSKLDAALKQFDIRLEAELKATNASLLASQAFFEQTSKRADEVISSAERREATRSRIFAAIGTMATVVVAIAGWFGLSDIIKIRELATASQQRADSVNEMVDRVQKNVLSIQANDEKLARATENVNDINKLLTTAIRIVLMRDFSGTVNYDSGDAIAIFEIVTRSGTEDTKQQIFLAILRGILNGDDRTNFRRFMTDIIKKDSIHPDDKIILHSYLLASMVLDRHLGDYDHEFPNFSKYAQFHRGQQLTASLKSNFPVETFKAYIDQMSASAASDSDKAAMKQKIDAIVSEVTHT